MGSVLRRLFTFVSAALLLACVALVLLALAATVAWVRSYWVTDTAWWNQPNRVHAAVVSRGELELFFHQVAATAPFRVLANRAYRAQPPSDLHLADSGLTIAWQRFGFGYAAGADTYGFRRIVLVPCWSIVTVAAVLAILCVLTRRRMRIANLRWQNRCASCGYDLRGSPVRCPECGAAVSRKAAAIP